MLLNGKTYNKRMLKMYSYSNYLKERQEFYNFIEQLQGCSIFKIKEEKEEEKGNVDSDFNNMFNGNNHVYYERDNYELL